MSTTLIKVLVQLSKGTSIVTPSGAPSAGTSVVVTDSTNVAQPAVVLTGNESPPWSFTASVASGAGSVTATDIDTSGTTLGTPVTQTFTEAGTGGGSGGQNNFLPTTSIAVTPVNGSTAASPLGAPLSNTLPGSSLPGNPSLRRP